MRADAEMVLASEGKTRVTRLDIWTNEEWKTEKGDHIVNLAVGLSPD